MTYDNVIEMLEEAGLPLAYDHLPKVSRQTRPSSFFCFREQITCSLMTRSTRKSTS